MDMVGNTLMPMGKGAAKIATDMADWFWNKSWVGKRWSNYFNDK